jgi:hypothetical protein
MSTWSISAFFVSTTGAFFRLFSLTNSVISASLSPESLSESPLLPASSLSFVISDKLSCSNCSSFNDSLI